ncbi:TetR/AcrR family transcriptional regulator [Hydrogenophaga sp. 5NK40-0174]|uniref:TetR/AcrR family transcriptional regulator n=1 Tax=Hydrogenophaga sp. 5NK40-0174 TaxID=3127649 RepID=UPI00310A9223
MARPSRQLDQALLDAGRLLYAAKGAAGLSVRAVAEAAGVTPSLFHYHFGSKQQFISALLQQLYEDMYAPLSLAAGQRGVPALSRLRAMLMVAGGFVQSQSALASRIWADAGQGDPATLAFLRRNVPRHLRLILGALAEADEEGSLPPQPLQARMSFLAGAVLAPIFLAERVPALAAEMPVLSAGWDKAVQSDSALAWRIDCALAGLQSRAHDALRSEDQPR